METEGMRRALQFLEGKVQISEIVTDASRSIMALLGMFVPLSWKHRFIFNNIQKKIFQATTTHWMYGISKKKLKKSLLEVGIDEDLIQR